MARQPHVIVLMADTVQRQALGCYGGFVRTPTIDALAGHATRFERLYQPANMCQPSRCTWMTGTLPSTHQVYCNGERFDRSQPTMLRRLADAGYRGGYLGLFHCWAQPDDRDGLDAWSWADWIHDHEAILAIPDEAARNARWQAELERMGMTGPEYALRDFHHHAGHTDFPLARHPAVRIADQAIAAIDDIDPARPHALWVSFWMPHEPWAPPREYLDRYRPQDMPLPRSLHDDRATRPPHQRQGAGAEAAAMLGPDLEGNLRRVLAAYAGCMELVDTQCGRILDALRRRGLYEDSVVAFITDHGTTHGAHGWLYKGGAYALDEISHVPAILKTPGQRQPRVVPDVVSSADFAPTILGFAGVDAGAVDGRAWSDVLAGERRAGARAFCQHLRGGPGAARSIRTGRWKYTLYGNGADELYDLDADPDELRNVVADVPAERRALREELVASIRASTDTFEVPAAAAG